MARRKSTWVEQVAEAQQDRRFVEWMAAMGERLAWFRASVLSDFVGEPHSREAVVFAEERLLGLFSSYEGISEVPDADEIIDGFVRFVGEAFVHGLGGRWMKIPRVEPGGVEETWYSVLVATSDRSDDTRNFTMPPTIYATVHRRTNTEFSRIWDRAVTSMRGNGRDPLTNTTDLFAQLAARESLVDLEGFVPKHPDNEVSVFVPAGRPVTQARVRAVFDRQFAGTSLVVSEEPYWIVATDRKTKQQIGVVLKIAGTSNAAGEYIPMILKGHPHVRAAEFEGATELLSLYTVKDPRDGLSKHLMELAEAFEEDFGTITYLPNAGTYLFGPAWRRPIRH